jgi:heptosyltransferase-2
MTMKILIIKLGYSETLDPGIGKVASLGDVLRTTPILWAVKEKFPDSHISWLVSENAEPLLRGNQFIDRILVWDEFVPFQLMREKVDVLINLEKIPGVAALSDMIDAWTKYGFRFDGNNGTYHSYERGLDFMEYIERKKNGQTVGDYWQKVLVEMLGVQWNGQPCIIGYTSKTTELFDIGLNFQVGAKWPTKAMPLDDWKKLEELLKEKGFTVSWQQGLGDLYEYIDWINSCKSVITQDSLGLHIALALKKKVIGLFGPTDPQEVYLYGCGQIVYPKQKCDSMPCYSPTCRSGLKCMESMDLNRIITAVFGHELERVDAPGEDL